MQCRGQRASGGSADHAAAGEEPNGGWGFRCLAAFGSNSVLNHEHVFDNFSRCDCFAVFSESVPFQRLKNPRNKLKRG